jgi:hypothetical protein
MLFRKYYVGNTMGISSPLWYNENDPGGQERSGSGTVHTPEPSLYPRPSYSLQSAITPTNTTGHNYFTLTVIKAKKIPQQTLCLKNPQILL